MRENEFTPEEIEINYDLIKKIEKHAKNYDSEPDKKTFLKNACAYEQKYILMNSVKPYDVLKYLDELDLKSSRLILEELNYWEINKLLNLFTSEDKKEFYRTFSDLSLINQFIVKDENASEYIEDLSVKRKIDLLNSSNTETVLATTIVYETLPNKAKERVAKSLTNVDALNALNQSSAYKEDKVIKEINLEKRQDTVIQQEVKEMTKEEIKKELNEEFEEKVKQQHLDKLKEIEMLNVKRAFFKDRIKFYKENYPEFKDIDENDENLFENMPEELRVIFEKDFIESKLNIDELNKKATEKAENKFEKTRKNVEFIKNSNMRDFVLRINSIAIFNSLCSQTNEELSKFKENFPDLYNEFSQYFGKSNAFNDLEPEKQDEIINKVQNHPILSSELKHRIDNVESSIGKMIYDKMEEEKIKIYYEELKNNPKMLDELNIIDKVDYQDFSDDEKLRLNNYLNKNVEVCKKIKQINDELVKNYNMNAKCVKDDVKFSDLLIAIDDKDRFKQLLSIALVDENISIDSSGNLNIGSYDKEKTPELDYSKYSVVGNGERNIGLVNNKWLLKLFEIKKQECESEEISNTLIFENEQKKTL